MDPLNEQKNHLQYEKSPYLLQHADNPVAWYPWSEEALSKARHENKPIFISIGYSTCHWCHVMAHESFEDDQVAELLNRNFIAIKVDREERPDLDTAFMQACQLLNGHGGWPLNLFLTPSGQPFYALTYVPKQRSRGQPGFIEIGEKIAELWQRQPEDLVSAAERLVSAVVELEQQQPQQAAQAALLKTAADNFRSQFDPVYAGFGRPPKFPQPHNAALLLRLAQRQNDPELHWMALYTLTRIADGGITDQLGGGMHRYSVDERWLVPHFEKMLYDQALIVDAYLDAWQASGADRFRRAASHVCNYVLRELQHPEGGFYCGEDADSEGREGTYYLWSSEELSSQLSKDNYDIFKEVYDITAEGNFEGKNILQRRQTLEQVATKQGRSTDQLRAQLAEISRQLLAIRSQRPHPHLDDKILVGWNGLMIAALARAGNLLANPDYTVAAERAWDFIRSKLLEGGDLVRRYRDGETAIAAFHEDYAYLIQGLIELFLAQGRADTLSTALELQQSCDRRFSDKDGIYYDAAADFGAGMGRGRSKQDGAIPAAASVTAHNLIRLARLCGRAEMEERAVALLNQQLPQADQYPTAFAYLLQALELHLSPAQTLVVRAASEADLTPAWHHIIHQFRPSLLLLRVRPAQDYADLVPHLQGKEPPTTGVMAWFCSGNSCQEPVTSAALLEELLARQAPLNTFSK